MWHLISRSIFLLGITLQLAAQPASVPKSDLTFDAASVKSAIPPDGVTVIGSSITGMSPDAALKFRRTGGPGTSGSGRIHYPLISLKELLNLAWDGVYAQIKSPDWLDTQTVAIDAVMPRNTTKEQFREMLRNLIVDRFNLKFHTEAKTAAGGYYLVVPNGDPTIKSEPKKLPVEVMVVDHMEKTPNAN